jgi:hypothetical protein
MIRERCVSGEARRGLGRIGEEARIARQAIAGLTCQQFDELHEVARDRLMRELRTYDPGSRLFTTLLWWRSNAPSASWSGSYGRSASAVGSTGARGPASGALSASVLLGIAPQDLNSVHVLLAITRLLLYSRSIPAQYCQKPCFFGGW